MCGSCVGLVYIEALINVVAGALLLAVFARTIVSWIPGAKIPLVGGLVASVTEPILSSIRRVLPATGPVDFSPFVALLLIQLATAVLLRILPPAV